MSPDEAGQGRTKSYGGACRTGRISTAADRAGRVGTRTAGVRVPPRACFATTIPGHRPEAVTQENNVSSSPGQDRAPRAGAVRSAMVAAAHLRSRRRDARYRRLAGSRHPDGTDARRGRCGTLSSRPKRRGWLGAVPVVIDRTGTVDRLLGAPSGSLRRSIRSTANDRPRERPCLPPPRAEPTTGTRIPITGRGRYNVARHLDPQREPSTDRNGGGRPSGEVLSAHLNKSGMRTVGHIRPALAELVDLGPSPRVLAAPTVKGLLPSVSDVRLHVGSAP